MLLPDQTYADYVARHIVQATEKTKSGASSVTSNSSFARTADFFENIPDFVGASLPTFLYTPQAKTTPADEFPELTESACTSSASAAAGPTVGEETDQAISSESETCDDMLRLCEDFLCRHRMRPDFFCQYHKAVRWVQSA